MRFITVYETKPRLATSTWEKQWIVAADRLVSSSLDDQDARTSLHQAFNEGTLLLYRIGKPGIAAMFCRSACELGVDVSSEFKIQQWINLCRLESAAANWSSAEKLLRQLETLGFCLCLDCEAKSKLATMIAVERLWNQLSSRQFHLIRAQRETMELDSPAYSFVTEAAIRALLAEGRIESAVSLCDSTAAHGGTLELASIVLKSTVCDLTQDERDKFVQAMLFLVISHTVHSVQVADMFLRKSLANNTDALGPAMEILTAVNAHIGDVVFAQNSGALELRPAAPDSAERVASRLSDLLRLIEFGARSAAK